MGIVIGAARRQRKGAETPDETLKALDQERTARKLETTLASPRSTEDLEPR